MNDQLFYQFWISEAEIPKKMGHNLLGANARATYGHARL